MMHLIPTHPVAQAAHQLLYQLQAPDFYDDSGYEAAAKIASLLKAEGILPQEVERFATFGKGVPHTTEETLHIEEVCYGLIARYADPSPVKMTPNLRLVS